MASVRKLIDAFLRRTDLDRNKLGSSYVITLTTAERLKYVFPVGIFALDSDNGKIYVGDGSSTGGTELIAEDVDVAWTDLGIVTTTIEATPDNNTAWEHLLTELGDIDMTGKTLSDCILFELSRIGGDASDTYGADARLLEFDIHYEIDSFGSNQEYIKD